MRKGMIALLGVLVVGLAVSLSAGQKPAEEREAAKARAAKVKLDRFVAHLVPRAGAVGVGSVLVAKVRSVPLEGGGAGLEFHTLEVSPARMLYGPRPKGEKFSLPVMPPRDLLVRKLTKGDKIIFALGKTPSRSLGAVRWSKQAEEAVLFALAPGWERGKCFRCPWCRQKGWKAGKGECGLCGGATGSGAFKLCAKCAAAAGRCQMCKRTVGPATRGVRLRLFGDLQVKVSVVPAAMPKVSAKQGEQIQLYVSARVKGKAAVSELLCPDGRALSGCETLSFIVESPGRREAAVLFPILPLPAAKAKLKPKPLTNSNGADRIFAARMVLDDKKKVFERPGRYTVRAVAGRLVSNPVIVVVKEPKPAAPVPQPEPRPRPARLENVVPQITPDGRGVQAVRGGKMLWKMKCSFVIGAIEQKDGLLVITSEDGKTVVTLDLATGKMISKRVAR